MERNSSDSAAIETVARDLLADLGSPLTAFVADCDEITFSRWAVGELSPSSTTERVLRAMSQAFCLISSADSVGVARAWFSGTNPELDGMSPAEALSAGNYERVLVVARNYARHG